MPGDGKVPALKWTRYQTERPTEAEIRQWFSLQSNIAVITGQISGVVVVDADSPEALQHLRTRLPWTPWQTRTARGFHVWYRHPGMPIRNTAKLQAENGRLALDVRGDGGYVIAPGSVHRCGCRYEYAGDWSVPRDRLPIFWVGWLQRPTPPPSMTPPRPRPTGDVVERARAYLAAIPKPEIGDGSDVAVFRQACHLLRGFALAPHDAASLLWEWAGGRPGWTREWIAQKVAHAERYGTEPLGGLR
jgi:hypothetical protein